MTQWSPMNNGFILMRSIKKVKWTQFFRFSTYYRFADRTSRPARAVMAYYALRAAWENEGRSERFPPVDYFLQRAVLAIPKADARSVSGSKLLAATREQASDLAGQWAHLVGPGYSSPKLPSR